ncbi:MAG: SLATT domain-containing protein, partial [Rhodoglobus sp.]
LVGAAFGAVRSSTTLVLAGVAVASLTTAVQAFVARKEVPGLEAFGTIGRDVLLARSTERATGFSEITDDMRSARSLDFVQAREKYYVERIEDQEKYYATKAAFHLRRSRMWLLLMLVAQVTGLIFSLLKAVLDGGPWDGIVGILSALAAAFIAWSQLRQHGLLAGTYQAQAVQMRDFARRLELVDEAQWPAFVASVENALIAEHTRWLSWQGRR